VEQALSMIVSQPVNKMAQASSMIDKRINFAAFMLPILPASPPMP
jgi:hypothetical protein